MWMEKNKYFYFLLLYSSKNVQYVYLYTTLKNYKSNYPEESNNDPTKTTIFAMNVNVGCCPISGPVFFICLNKHANLQYTVFYLFQSPLSITVSC